MPSDKTKTKTQTQTVTACAECNRVVWADDTDDAGLCCFCVPESAPKETKMKAKA